MDKSTLEPMKYFREKTAGGTFYRVTAVSPGKSGLDKALEELAVNRMLRESNII